MIHAESPANIQEAVADKGYHAAETLALVNEMLGVRTYIPEQKRSAPWNWQERTAAERRAITGQPSACAVARSKKLQRRRSELSRTKFRSRVRDRRRQTLLAARHLRKSPNDICCKSRRGTSG